MNGKFGGGNGSSTSPYLIEDADDLNAIRNHPSSYFQLINDINLGNGKYNTGQGWNPIRDFTGFLEGNNHKIINLYINRPGEDFVGFFKNVYSAVQNIIFVDPEIIGRNYVGTVVGYYFCDTWSDTGIAYTGFKNVLVLNANVKGNKSVGGFAGGVSDHYLTHSKGYIDKFVRHGILNGLFVVGNIESNEGVAYGIGKNISVESSNYKCDFNGYFFVGEQARGYRRDSWNGFWANCDANCAGSGAYPRANVTFTNCFTKMLKNSSTFTYYAISNADYSTFSGCYADNSEFSPIVATGIEYKNLSHIDYSTSDKLPNIDKSLFKKEWQSKVEPFNLNKDSIYFKTKDGYVTYNFTTKEFEVKYVKFTNQNSIKIIQNGMTRAELSKIPSDKLKELQDENSKIIIVNCIQAHERIVSKLENVEVSKFKEYLDKNIFKNKIQFDKYNDKIMNIIRI